MTEENGRYSMLNQAAVLVDAGDRPGRVYENGAGNIIREMYPTPLIIGFVVQSAI